jgi:hypothetical protein
MNVSLSLFVSIPCMTFLTIACILINSNHKCTPWSASIIDPYCCGFTRAFIYPTWCPSSTREWSMPIQYPRECHSCLRHVIMISHVPSCIQPDRSIQEEVISDRVKDRFGLEVLTLKEDVSLGGRTWENIFPSRASDKAVRQRGLSDEHNMIEVYNVLCHPRMEWRAAWESEKFSSFQLSWYTLFSAVNASFIVFLCSPSFRKSRDEISFEGKGCNTSCY